MSAKKYIIKDGNSSTSKDLILDARIHQLLKSFSLVLSPGSHLSPFGLTDTLIFYISSQKCVKILI